MKDSLKNLRTAFTEVFTHSSYMALAGVLAITVLLIVIWLPNLGLMNKILATSSAPFEDTVKVAFILLGGIRTNFTFLSAGYTIAIAVLFGVNTAMVAYFLKRTRSRRAGQAAAVGFGGVASGVFGVGCAVCGSFILSSVLSSFGAAGAITLLPLRGGEFGILSVALLLVSVLLISRKIASPISCNLS